MCGSIGPIKVYQKKYVGDRQLKQVNVREVKRRFAELDLPVV